MANTDTQLYIQFVFSVKGRENLINEKFRDELEKVMSGIFSKHKTYAIYCNPDHTHIFVGLHNSYEEIRANAPRFINFV